MLMLLVNCWELFPTSTNRQIYQLVIIRSAIFWVKCTCLHKQQDLVAHKFKTVYSRPGCAIINPVASCWITRLFHGWLVTGWWQSSPRLEFSSALNYLCPQSTKQRIWILPKTMNNSIYENFYLACQQTVFKVSI